MYILILIGSALYRTWFFSRLRFEEWFSNVTYMISNGPFGRLPTHLQVVEPLKA